MNRLARIALVAALLATVPFTASAGATSKDFDRNSAVNKFDFFTGTATAPTSITVAWPYKTAGTLVDFVCHQITAGTGGTSVSIDVQKNGTTMLSTTATITLAAGADKVVDLKGEVAAVSGGTRPVRKPQGAAVRVSKGDLIKIVSTESGSYSPHPTYECSAIFQPDA